MNGNIKDYLNEIINKYKKQKRKNTKISILSVVVVFTIFTILSVPAITMEKQESLEEIKEGIVALPENEIIDENITSEDSEDEEIPQDSENETTETPDISEDEINQSEDDASNVQKEGTGNFRVVIDELPEGLKTDVRIMLTPSNEYEYQEDYDYEIKDLNGNIKSKGKATFNIGTYAENSEGYLFTGVELGDVITILNVEETKKLSSEEEAITAKVEVVPPTDEYTIIYDKGNVLPIKKSETQTIKVKIEKQSFETKDVFNNGNYSLEYILGNYNVFSFNDVQANHIVGPIVAKNEAYATANYAGAILYTSDYSRGISSYVGNVSAVSSNSPDPQATFALNYDYDKYENADQPPTFYTKLSGKKVKSEGTEWYSKYYFYPDGNKPRFVSPNRSGESKVLQSDNYIDFNSARASIMNQSKNLLEDQSNIKVSPDGSGTLKLDVGKKYIIENASNLKEVDFIYPNGYDPFNNPYPHSTIINIASDTLFKGKIAGNDYHLFPKIMVNGQIFDGAKQGENGEYGSANNILWNLPNIKSDKVAIQINADILGHIVAPNAKFWAYDETGNWHGGNMNGCAIVDSWHGGDIESHIWPYDPTPAPVDPVDILLKGHKNLIGRPLKDSEFNFTLNTVDGSKPDGVQNIPQTVSVKENGEIEFLPITFTKPGTYEFIIKEVIPQTPEENMKYDKSEYKVIVSVIENNNKLEASYKVYKIVDSEVNKLEPQEEVKDIIFTNEYGQVNTTDLSFTKTDSSNTEIVLPGAEFELVEVDTNGNTIENSNKYTAISNEQGTVEFTGIPSGKKYKMTEVKAPDGYIEPNGYWIVEISANGEIKIDSFGDAPQIGSDNIITNEPYDYILPDTGGNGTLNYILIGMFMITTAVAISIIRIQ